VTTFKIPAGSIVTIEVPGLAAVRIDTYRRMIAIDHVSGSAEGEPLSPEWIVRDLRDGTWGDFHSLRPASACGHAECAASEHDTQAQES
jgi:hypothetical protein